MLLYITLFNHLNKKTQYFRNHYHHYFIISADFKGTSHSTMDVLARTMLGTAGEKMTTNGINLRDLRLCTSDVYNRAGCKLRRGGLRKVSSIVYCCVATLVTGDKVTLNEYIGNDYHSHDPGPFKTLKQSIFEEDKVPETYKIPGGYPASSRLGTTTTQVKINSSK